MEIIKSNIEDKKALYRMTHGESNKPSNNVGTVLEVNSWAYVEDTNKKNGEAQRILYLDTDCGIFGTISPTFISAFMDITEAFGDDFSHIEIVGGKSKNGRDFVSCELVD